MSSTDCIFCKIVAGEIPASRIYEDEKTLGFLDINPVTPGHLLLIPKEHHPMLTDVPDDLLQHMIVTAKKLMKAMKRSLEVDFVVLSVVGIEVPHFHIHLVPRKHSDDLANWWPTSPYKDGEVDDVLNRLKDIHDKLED